jgi:2-aminoadipate transaminase
MSLARRQMLVALARAHGAAVIEDDPYRLLRYRGADVPSIASLADGVNVVQAGSYSKTFVPGIRVGWAVTAPELVRRMAAAKQTTDSSTSSLGQRLVLEFARRGRFAPHLEALRQLYADKQDRARAALAREFAGTGVGWNSPEGGFYLWVRLPAALSTRRLLDAALEEGVAFVPGDAFGIAGDHADALRFSYSSPTPDRIDEGVRRLRRAFDRIRA